MNIGNIGMYYYYYNLLNQKLDKKNVQVITNDPVGHNIDFQITVEYIVNNKDYIPFIYLFKTIDAHVYEKTHKYATKQSK